MKLREFIDRLELLSDNGRNDLMDVIVQDVLTDFESPVENAFIADHGMLDISDDYYQYVMLEIKL